MSTSRLPAVLAALLVSFPAAHALAWPSLDPEGARTPLLGGRWTILLGAEASVTGASADPRGPAPRADLDGVAAMRDEEGRLAVRSTLLFATAPPDLEAVVRALPAPCAAPTITALPDHEGIVAITCAEPSPDGAFRPLVLYATHTDRWVDRIEIQLELDEASDVAAAVAFANAVAGSIRAEDVAPAVERGTVEVARVCVSGDAADPFTVTLPEDWIATRHTDGDRSLLQLVRVAALGTPRSIASVVFAPPGAAPATLPAGVGARRAGRVLGTDVEWLEVIGPADLPGLREVALSISVACGEGAEPFAGNAQLSAGGLSRTLDQGTAVLETLSLGGDRGHTASVSVIGTEEEAPPAAEPESDTSADDAAAEETSHLWSMGIAAASITLLVLALILRARTTRPK